MSYWRILFLPIVPVPPQGRRLVWLLVGLQASLLAMAVSDITGESLFANIAGWLNFVINTYFGAYNTARLALPWPEEDDND